MRYQEEDIQLPVDVAGVRFRNPFYVASGPTTMTVEQLTRIEETGWGGASVKLSFDPPAYINRHPRYGYWPDQGILSFTTERRMLFEESLRLIEQARRRTSRIVLFSNFTYAGHRGLAGWVDMAQGFESAGAHVNEINMCCPNMSYNVELSQGEGGQGPRTGASLGQQLETVKSIVAAIKQSTAIPLFVKLTPEGGRIAHVAKACYEAGADAVGTTANRLAIHHVDLDNPTRSPIALQDEISMQCMCSTWVHPLALRDVYEIRTVNGPDLPITGTGGVSDWRTAAEMFLCGANLVGICAETLISGFGFLPQLVREFKEWMSHQGFTSVGSLTSLVPPAIRTAPEVTLYQGHARIRDNRLSAPCVQACPASVPAQAYVSKIAEEEFREAYEILTSATPLMNICALVCHHPCEEACTRSHKDEPIKIRELKHFLVEKARQQGWSSGKAPTSRNGKRVAIVGAGPSGLAAAALLAQAGYEITVFEASSRPGGMLRWALPSFRCPEDVLDQEIQRIESLGACFQFGRVLGKDLLLQDLRRDFDAVYIAVGAQKSVSLGIPGEDAQGVIPALDFLRSVASGTRPEPARRVAVIGGGFTALDAARSALRLGAGQVFVVYRRTREEMPASEEEISQAEEEGVRIIYLAAPREILLRDGRMWAISLQSQVLGDPDVSGRRRPEPVEGAWFSLQVDCVITALGQRVELQGETGLVIGRTGTLQVGDSGSVGVKGVFAGGDAVLGASSVIEAIATAKRAASGIDRFLRGSEAVIPSSNGAGQVSVDEVLRRHGKEPRRWRVALHFPPGRERVKDFAPFTPVLNDREAVEEAARCLRCGCGEGCMICHDICKTFAYRKEETRVVLDEDKCVGCGMCAWRCPIGNIEMIRASTQPI